jgi:hypothetical protein
MALEDFFDSEVGIAVAATALVLSPRVRNLLRQGAVYGLAGVLKATDSVTSAAHGVATEVQQTAAQGAAAAQETATQAKATARGSRGTQQTPGQ